MYKTLSTKLSLLLLLTLSCEEENIIPTFKLQVSHRDSTLVALLEPQKVRYDLQEVVLVSFQTPDSLHKVKWLGVDSTIQYDNPIQIFIQGDTELKAEFQVKVQDTITRPDNGQPSSPNKPSEPSKPAPPIEPDLDPKEWIPATQKTNLNIIVHGQGTYSDDMQIDSSYTEGDIINVFAKPNNDDHYLEGWYKNGVRVSTIPVYPLHYKAIDKYELVFQPFSTLTVKKSVSAEIYRSPPQKQVQTQREA